MNNSTTQLLAWLDCDKAVDEILDILAKDPDAAFIIREAEREVEYGS